MKRSASAKWRGDLKSGKGIIDTESEALSKVPYSFGMRFGADKGTNPEELIAAAHASCFAMALTAEFNKQKIDTESIDIEATVNLEKGSNDWSITAVHLEVFVSVPGAAVDLVNEAAESAKKNCPISKLLKAHISMNLSLISQPEDIQQLKQQ